MTWNFIQNAKNPIAKERLNIFVPISAEMQSRLKQEIAIIILFKECPSFRFQVYYFSQKYHGTLVSTPQKINKYK